jgi:Family of unknown function (DUF6011)
MRALLDDALPFMFAGNATVTIREGQTRYTYRIRAAKNNPGIHFVALLTGPDNEDDYTYLGTVFDREVFRLTKKSLWQKTSSPVVIFNRTLNYLVKGLRLDMEIWHEGRCGHCGRKLTVPESIARGIGPECVSRMG